MARFLVTTSKGLENLLEQELQSYSIDNIKLSVSSVWFEGTLEQAYQVCYCSRLANKVFLELTSAPCSGKDDLYQIAQSVDWSMQFKDRSTFSVDFNGVTEKLRNTQFSAQVVKDAIVDLFQDEFGRRPNVDKANADIRIQGRLIKNNAHIFIDLCGQSLHQRGYRVNAGRAPIKENIAAAVVMRSGWLEQTEQPLIDYFCGSGTLLIEAAQMALNMPAQQYRRVWGFEHWLGHNPNLFEQVKTQADAQIKTDLKLRLYGIDINTRELKTAEQNAKDAGVDDFIHFQRGNALDSLIDFNEAGHIISNPPYGERLEDELKIASLYLDFGAAIKQKYENWQLTVISSAQEQLRQLKLSASKKYKVKNAALDCVIAKYTIEAGSGVDPRENMALEFQNRLKKNVKQLAKLAKQIPTECYRVYDADLPNYNVAIDVYGDSLVIQEYAAPKNIPIEKTRARLNEVLLTAPGILEIETSKVALKVRKRQKGNEQYQRSTNRDEYFAVQEANALFYVNIHDFLDTGLFLDHRDMRLLIQQQAKDKTVLNLFSYTCSVSVHAVLGGAKQVTSVDLSKKYLDWGKQNFELNNINPAWHQFVAQDSLEWLKNSKQSFDLIFIDPPSFSNSKKLETTFDVQRDHIALISNALAKLNAGGEIYFSNNLRTFKLDEAAMVELGLTFTDLSEKTLPFDFKRRANIRQVWKIQRK
ncbi:bifunctional 23S rRNA (guanine(2069)-N(7))-methyltransferase RlmK/23S rRNA (guanine(2445)-N(2))-methyltransferase RlmL [Catenovulum sp. 2E275]|uniref:bifunctional 23S rRNA (guanine(2069)-N(7))-methyltransferase RlmK/23S rRNA (guanine(2445)-N(2))-methyltransferase RlmL n=1 Tax=Catenovulum sp. 2E275 TaxID=2980497 RepID=UPI0021D03C86|nr:bifunctional 23S rRNA (guanine(2069)-N(7))-methyltransferase RlmK/23S rRNA (guanine(2445)-N(2))-methyltransferase RlmL [Catenovulum sp. 2E275]MCU4674450.1 bifunctional 23S rRNA (guanine(2069)-N(7))-methyltransferase RlmK/23S rRNA (guanine(2445)-N(2))-methyltransferase RlmL [Catenovulum sp. 2E275]